MQVRGIKEAFFLECIKNQGEKGNAHRHTMQVEHGIKDRLNHALITFLYGGLHYMVQPSKSPMKQRAKYSSPPTSALSPCLASMTVNSLIDSDLFHYIFLIRT